MAGVKRTIGVALDGLTLTTPVAIASGCAGTGRELAGLVDLHRVGAVVSRSITLHPRKGTRTPRIAESPSGVVWETGLQNPGIESFVAEELPRLARAQIPVIVSIAGTSMEEYVRLTSLLQNVAGVAALEVYLSGPDDELDREVMGSRPDRAAEIIGAVGRMSTVPVFAKLPALSTDLVEVATAVMRAGASGLTLLGPVPALGVNASRLRPELGAVTGYLSGPAVRPLVLRGVFEVSRAMPEVPIFAVGGVTTGEDAVEMLLAGAWAVQVGTATLVDPVAPVKIAQGIHAYLREKGLASPAEIRGRLRLPTASPSGEPG